MMVDLLVGLAIGVGIGVVVRTAMTRRVARASQEEAARLLLEARERQNEMLLEAKDEAIKFRREAESEHRERRAELQRQERRLVQKEENLDRKAEGMERKERQLQTKEQEIDRVREEVDELKRRELSELERASQMTAGEAKETLLQTIESEVRLDASRRIREIEAQLKEEADRRARKIVALAIQRCATDVVSETTVSVVPIPSDDMKGRLIGREGRNIRALEAATGVDLIIDDTPDVVTLSCLDPVRREVARLTLNKLIVDGRIHPARIEEAVGKARQEVDATIREEGEQAAYKAGVHGLHPEMIRLLGRLKFRYSYGQNVLMHVVEVANIAAIMAAELGADVNVSRRGGLLHDIGKSVDHEIEGPHALIGKDIGQRYGLSAKVNHCIASHHADEEPQTVEATIVAVADAVSGSRPGARRDSVDHYVKRLEALEAVANSFDGVEKSFAIQAGREIRVIVRPDQVDDLGSIRLARDVVKKIEETLEYPGQIKVTVIRETRAVEYAR
jgi:ribonuclease Y